MSEFDEELRKLAKTRPADVSAIGVARLVKHIEEQEARAEAAEARVAELEAAQRWIPVNERLPEEKQNVLVLGSDGYVFNWRYSSDWRYSGLEPQPFDWTHWRPFEPPQEVEG